jgi:hypothetical protein
MASQLLVFSSNATPAKVFSFGGEGLGFNPSHTTASRRQKHQSGIGKADNLTFEIILYEAVQPFQRGSQFHLP